MRGENSQSLKRNNRAMVLEMVLTGNACARYELARATGLKKATMGNIVADLIGNKYIAEGEFVATKNAGRKPIDLILAPDAPKVIGVHIGRDECRAILTDLQLNIIQRTESIRLIDETVESILDKASGLIQQLLGSADRLLGIGIGTIGQHDVQSGNVLCPVDFFGIRDIPLKRTIAERFQLPVYVDNDMNGAAQAERLYGSGRDVDSFLYLGITKGVGAGIVMDGELLGNSSGFVGEIGHMSVNIHGEKCSCGSNGCLELYTSVDRIEREIAARRGFYRPFAECVAEERDPDVERVLSEVCDILAAALNGMVNMLDCERIVIGHDASVLPDRYLTRIEEDLNRKILARDYKRVQICRASFGVHTPVCGAAASMIKQLFNGRLLIC